MSLILNIWRFHCCSWRASSFIVWFAVLTSSQFPENSELETGGVRSISLSCAEPQPWWTKRTRTWCSSWTTILPSMGYTDASSCLALNSNVQTSVSTSVQPSAQWFSAWTLYDESSYGITVHSTHQPSPSQSALVRSSLCIPHRQSTVAISACVSSICVSNHSSLCVPPAPIRFCAFYFYTSERFFFFAVHTIANLIAISACGFHGVHSIMCFRSVRSACWPSHQCNQCRSTCRPSPSCAFYFCTSEQESLRIPPIRHHHRNQHLCVPVCAFHPPAIHRCNQCVCVRHLRQQPQFTVLSNCHNQNLCFLFLHLWVVVRHKGYPSNIFKNA